MGFQLIFLVSNLERFNLLVLFFPIKKQDPKEVQSTQIRGMGIKSIAQSMFHLEWGFKLENNYSFLFLYPLCIFHEILLSLSPCFKITTCVIKCLFSIEIPSIIFFSSLIFLNLCCGNMYCSGIIQIFCYRRFESNTACPRQQPSLKYFLSDSQEMVKNS